MMGERESFSVNSDNKGLMRLYAPNGGQPLKIDTVIFYYYIFCGITISETVMLFFR